MTGECDCGEDYDEGSPKCVACLKDFDRRDGFEAVEVMRAKKQDGSCPVCGGQNVEFDSPEVEGDPVSVIRQTYCPDCESTWHDWYDYTSSVLTIRRGQDVE